jgi:hypothetical protein
MRGQTRKGSEGRSRDQRDADEHREMRTQAGKKTWMRWEDIFQRQKAEHEGRKNLASVFGSSLLLPLHLLANSIHECMEIYPSSPIFGSFMFIP